MHHGKILSLLSIVSKKKKKKATLGTTSWMGSVPYLSLQKTQSFSINHPRASSWGSAMGLPCISLPMMALIRIAWASWLNWQWRVNEVHVVLCHAC